MLKRINKWIGRKWIDPVWSKVFAGIILGALSLIVTILISLVKEIPINDLYLMSVASYVKVSYFAIFIFVLIVLSFLIPLFYFDILKIKTKLYRRIIVANKDFLKDKNSMEALFPGKWVNNYQLKDGRKGQEIVEIKNGTEYYAHGKHIFDIDSFSLDKTNGVLIFRKTGIGTDSRKALNLLRIINEKYFEGTEPDGVSVIYTRVE